MNCEATQSWLLTAKAADPLPAEVKLHVQGCPQCSLARQRLARLDQVMKRLPRPPANPIAKNRLLRRLEQAPQASHRPVILITRTRFGRSRRLYAVLGAAAALVVVGLGLGWWLGGAGSQDRRMAAVLTPVPPEVLRQAGATGEGDLIARTLEDDLRLAGTPSPGERVEALARMASGLGREALRLAEQGPLEDLPLVAGLYERVVLTGLVGRVKALTSQQRDVLPPLVKQLQETAREAKRLGQGAQPGAVKYLGAIASAAGDVSQALATGGRSVPPPELSFTAAPPGTPRALLGALVMKGLGLAEEDDPLRRADYCTDVADQYVETIMHAAALGHPEQSSTWGQQLDEVMDRGVAANLARAQAAGLDGPREAEFERVSQRAARATAVLERNLERAPAAARAGLQRALEASRHGRERAMQAGKGKREHPGPPGPKGGKDFLGKGKGPPFVPPGQQKKRDKSDAIQPQEKPSSDK